MGRQGDGVLTALIVSERAARYDAWFDTLLGTAMDRPESRAVLDLAAPLPGEDALRAACGTGIYTRRLAGAGVMVTGLGEIAGALFCPGLAVEDDGRDDGERADEPGGHGADRARLTRG
ncbi:hypothetical protein FSW04_11965 [Baekduia soli]|uniref:Uncharacterized protein n=1 Tax=Baekduia soli TaxID=496014 RepID=A0A5B8U513_9ACTN|nr:hypothetical protein [Baekduia soli]QEC48209.1 hypothetical protein FSW04_11965 [Baekduia soli]